MGPGGREPLYRLRFRSAALPDAHLDALFPVQLVNAQDVRCFLICSTSKTSASMCSYPPECSLTGDWISCRCAASESSNALCFLSSPAPYASCRKSASSEPPLSCRVDQLVGVSRVVLHADRRPDSRHHVASTDGNTIRDGARFQAISPSAGVQQKRLDRLRNRQGKCRACPPLIKHVSTCIVLILGQSCSDMMIVR